MSTALAFIAAGHTRNAPYSRKPADRLFIFQTGNWHITSEKRIPSLCGLLECKDVGAFQGWFLGNSAATIYTV